MNCVKRNRKNKNRNFTGNCAQLENVIENRFII